MRSTKILHWSSHLLFKFLINYQGYAILNKRMLNKKEWHVSTAATTASVSSDVNRWQKLWMWWKRRRCTSSGRREPTRGCSCGKEAEISLRPRLQMNQPRDGPATLLSDRWHRGFAATARCRLRWPESEAGLQMCWRWLQL